jgi:hypothetical protein
MLPNKPGPGRPGGERGPASHGHGPSFTYFASFAPPRPVIWGASVHLIRGWEARGKKRRRRRKPGVSPRSGSCQPHGHGTGLHWPPTGASPQAFLRFLRNPKTLVAPEPRLRCASRGGERSLAPARPGAAAGSGKGCCLKRPDAATWPKRVELPSVFPAHLIA